MKKKIHAGIGEKRTVKYVDIATLHLDPSNPRLPEEVQGKSEFEILKALYDFFDLDELAFSMAQNGYFDEEPIVVINDPKGKGKGFIVIEGNRRVATIKILLDSTIQKKFAIKNWPSVDQAVKEDLSLIPAIPYKSRDEILPYLGIRHIAGIKKWGSYAKARYVANMVEDGYDMDDIQAQIGDRQNSARKHYLCYRLTQLAKSEFDFDIEPVKENFSYLILATGQGSIKRYLSIPQSLNNVDMKKPIPPKGLKNLKNFFSLVFGESKEKRSVLDESRDITNYLSDVLASEEATDYLITTRDLSAAYERSDGEENMVKKYLANANRKLESVLGIVHRHKTPDVLDEISKCQETIERLAKVAFEEKKK
ncbi:MAG: hypothetical protein WCO26_04175 [Deltaproteobacteria bacterium]